MWQFMGNYLRILFIFVHTLFNLHLIGVVYKLGTELSAVSTLAGVRANNELVCGDTDRWKLVISY